MRLLRIEIELAEDESYEDAVQRYRDLLVNPNQHRPVSFALVDGEPEAAEQPPPA